MVNGTSLIGGFGRRQATFLIYPRYTYYPIFLRLLCLSSPLPWVRGNGLDFFSF